MVRLRAARRASALLPCLARVCASLASPRILAPTDRDPSCILVHRSSCSRAGPSSSRAALVLVAGPGVLPSQRPRRPRRSGAYRHGLILRREECERVRHRRGSDSHRTLTGHEDVSLCRLAKTARKVRMGLVDWLYALLAYLGWWRKAATVVFLGA